MKLLIFLKFNVNYRILDINPEYSSSQEEGLNCTLDYPLILHLLCSPLQGAPILDKAWPQPARGKNNNCGMSLREAD